ncbi:MAG: hypothetical protein COB66_03915 [Coxiella sp. (in: Bacteria)]|nr:MAG: hypothetical protein COB66_03915 [Coxiella sp. (in: g-proteobacteria)]
MSRTEKRTGTRFHLALATKSGFDKLIMGPYLRTPQWISLMQQAQYPEVRLCDQEGMTDADAKTFYDSLLSENKITLKAAMLQLTLNKFSLLDRFVTCFGIKTASEWKKLAGSATYHHALLGTADVRPDEFAKLVNALDTTTKGVLLSVHPYITDELWATSLLNVDDVRMRDFESIITKYITIDTANDPVINHILERFFTSIMAQAGDFLDLLTSSRGLLILYQYNETFQSLVTHAATCIAASHLKEAPRITDDIDENPEELTTLKPPTFDLTMKHMLTRFYTSIIAQASNVTHLLTAAQSLLVLYPFNKIVQLDVSHAAMSVGVPHLQEAPQVPDEISEQAEERSIIKPPTSDNMIMAAELLEQRSQHMLAVHQYCRALNLEGSVKPPLLVMHIANVATQQNIKTAYQAVIGLLDNCIQDGLVTWHAHRDPISDLKQLLVLERVRNGLCTLSPPQTQWQLAKPLHRALLSTTAAIKFRAGQMLVDDSQLSALSNLWLQVQDFYQEGSDEWLSATLQLSDITPSDTNKLLRKVIQLSSEPQQVTEAMLLTRVYLELRTKDNPNIMGCYHHQQQVPSTFFRSQRYKTVIREDRVRSMMLLFSKFDRDRGGLLELLNEHINPLKFTEADIKILYEKLRIVTPTPAATDEWVSLPPPPSLASAPPPDSEPPAYKK